MKRVVVTGMGVVTALGDNWPEFVAKLQAGTSAIRRLEDWATYKDLNTNLAGPIEDFVVPAHYPRKKIRSMGRVALLSTRATELALIDAGLIDDPIVQSGAMGVAYGSSTGSTDAARDFAVMLDKRDIGGAPATTYIRMMGHTAPV